MNSLLDEALQALASTLDEYLAVAAGRKIGFALLTFDFGDDGPKYGGYISNAQRPDMIKALREAADVLEAGQDIPAAVGEG